MSSRSRELMARCGLACVLTTAAVAGRSFGGGCTPDWLPGQGVPGISGAVQAQVMWDPDGPGGQAERLVVAGQFLVAGDTLATNVAMWDGTQWQAMGDGLAGDLMSSRLPEVSSLVVMPNGDLIAGGSFVASGATELRHVAKWNGASWQPLYVNGSTIDVGNVLSSAVYAMTVMPNGDLAVGGIFSEAGGVAAESVAAWNGSAWYALPGIATGSVEAMTIWNGKLAVGGTVFGPGPESTRGQYVLYWDGSAWQSFGTTGARGTNSLVESMTVMPNGDLVVGGLFDTAGSASVAGLAKWDGSAWSDVGGGLSDGFGVSIQALTTDSNGDLIVGGQFVSAGGPIGAGTPVNGLAKWDGSTWTSLWSHDTDGRPSLFSVLPGPGGSMIVGGRFYSADGVPARSVARFDGSAWHAYGANGTNGSVAAFEKTAAGDIVVGGNFKLLEGASVNHVAVQNGSTWSGLGSGVYATGGFVIYNLPFPTVSALLVLPSGDIVAGGHELATSGGGAATNVALYSSGSWTAYSPALNSGLGLFGPFLPPFGLVKCLAKLPNDHIVAGGVFFFDGDLYTPHFLAEWDGTSWSDLGGEGAGPDFFVHDLLVDGNDLYIAGEFTFVGGVTGTAGIARWDGTEFHALGTGVNAGGGVMSLAKKDGYIYAAGFFTAVGNSTADDTPVDRIARWNGSSWSALPGGGFNFEVDALAVLPSGDLVAGGNFTDTIVGTTPRASRIARWDGAAWHPMGVGIDPERSNPGDDLSKVYALAVDDDGTLWVGGLFSTVDGQVSANIARWGCTVAACQADFNGVNGVTVQDIFDFLTAWLAGSPSADFNHVNGVTVQDIFDFLTAWLAGC